MNQVTTNQTRSPDQRRAYNPHASVWVEASAGTGKTTVLTERVMTLLVTGAMPRRILCLTYTNAAAAEMADRIARGLAEWTRASNEDLSAALKELLGRVPTDEELSRAPTLFARVLDEPGGLTIETIHGFCQSILRRFPVEAGVAPHFQLITEQDARDLIHEAMDRTLQREDTVTRAAIDTVTTWVHELRFPQLMNDIIANRGRLARLIDAHAGETTRDRATRMIDALYSALDISPEENAEQIRDKACAEGVFDRAGLKAAAACLLEGSKTDKERGQTIADWLAADADGRVEMFDGYVSVFVTKDHAVRDKLMTKGLKEKAPEALDVLESEAERLLAVDNRMRAHVLAGATGALVRLANAMLEEYARLKDERGALDYDDLILKTRDLLEHRASAAWVLFKLDGGIDHILIDEAQDTSPEQWRIIDKLAEEFFAGIGARERERSIFAVGDYKQSIYSFQGADPEGFRRMREGFAERAREAEKGWDEVDLTLSYRSVPDVLAAVDAVFAGRPASVGVVAENETLHHEASRADHPGLVEVWPTVEPTGEEDPDPWKPPVERASVPHPRARLAKLVAHRIHKMVADKEVLAARARPIRPRDIMVLVRRRTGFVEELVRQLKALKVDVTGVDRLKLTEHIAVMDMMALGHFLLMPGDDLTLATVLKSPLIGLDEDALFDLAYGRDGTLWEALRKKAKAGDNPAFAAARKELGALLDLVDFLPPFELYSHILNEREGRKKLLARLGPDADDPLGEFLNLALSFEDSHTPSLQSFLHWLQAGEIEVKRDLERTERDAVRIMTVHGAKGLQAPVVFLPDTIHVNERRGPLFWARGDKGDDAALIWPPRAAYRTGFAQAAIEQEVERQAEEYRRLLYVGMTRAEDRLYICGAETKQEMPETTWYRLVGDALGYMAEETESDFLKEMAETEKTTVLRLTSEGSGRMDRAKDRDFPSDETAPAPLPDWARRPPAPEPEPARPLAPSRPAEDPPVISPLSGVDEGRFKRGRLIHTLLQVLPDLEPSRRRDAAKEFLARPAHDLSKDAQTEILSELMAVLDHPDFADLFGPNSRAEVPLVALLGRHVMSGQVDRLVVRDNEVLVVDYKTNRPPPETVEAVPDVYLRQMAAYRAALEKIYPDKEILCALLWTDGARLMALPASVLDDVVIDKA